MNKILNNKIHFVGDSHVGMFSGIDKILPQWPKKHPDRWECFKTYRLGAHTAYNLSTKHSDSNSKLKSVLKKIRRGSVIVVSYGEIDCRVHLLKQSLLNKKDLKKTIDECVDRYFQAVKYVLNSGYKVIVFEPVASSPVFVNYKEFVTFGSVKERNLVTALFNKELRRKSKLNKIPVLSINKHLLNKDMTTNKKYYYDPIHVSNIAVKFVVNQIKKAINGFDHYSGLDINFTYESTSGLKLNKSAYLVYTKFKYLIQEHFFKNKNIFNIDPSREASLVKRYGRYFNSYYESISNKKE